MKSVATDLLRLLPGEASEQWPMSARFIQAFSHGSMSVELYAPVGSDPQTPHAQDELYFTISGHGEFVLAGERNLIWPRHGFLCASGRRTPL